MTYLHAQRRWIGDDAVAALRVRAMNQSWDQDAAQPRLKVEYRSERIERLGGREAMVAQLNQWGEQGWDVFQIDEIDGALQVWLRRELPATLAGLRSSQRLTRRPRHNAASLPA
ncbi:MAG: hypothetical protein ACRDJE_12695 [Dehalococcoidia bacterium]